MDNLYIAIVDFLCTCYVVEFVADLTFGEGQEFPLFSAQILPVALLSESP